GEEGGSGCRHGTCNNSATTGAPRENCTVTITVKIDPPGDPALASVRVCRLDGPGLAVQPDVLTVEEPLEVRLGCHIGARRVHRALSITMGTPGRTGSTATPAPSAPARPRPLPPRPLPPRGESRCPWSSSPPLLGRSQALT